MKSEIMGWAKRRWTIWQLRKLPRVTIRRVERPAFRDTFYSPQLIRARRAASNIRRLRTRSANDQIWKRIGFNFSVVASVSFFLDINNPEEIGLTIEEFNDLCQIYGLPELMIISEAV